MTRLLVAAILCAAITSLAAAPTQALRVSETDIWYYSGGKWVQGTRGLIASLGTSATTLSQAVIGGGYGNTGCTITSTGAGSFNGAVRVDGLLTATGGVVLDGWTIADSTGAMSGGSGASITLNTNKVVLNASNGDATLARDLTVGRNATVSGTATVNALATTTTATVGSTLTVTGAAAVGSTLSVGGATTLSSTLGVTGASTLTGAVTCGGTLAVAGNATVSGTLGYKTPIIVNTTGSETLTAAQSGSTVVCTKSTGATTITLPDPSSSTVGVVFTVVQTENQNVDIVPTNPDGNSLVADGVGTSDKASLATSSHKIGAAARIIGISATKWFVTALSPTCPLTVEPAD